MARASEAMAPEKDRRAGLQKYRREDSEIELGQ
jgi:hypothetical protein